MIASDLLRRSTSTVACSKLGTITPRKRKGGSIGYTAQIRIKRKGAPVHTESQTFDRRAAANSWLKKRESELFQVGEIERLQQPDPLLSEAIDRYIGESTRELGRTKAQVLRTIKTMPIAELRCSAVGSADIVTFAKALKVQPQTVANYLAHLSSVFAVARPAWRYQLDQTAMKDALTVLKKLGVTSKSRKRDRRPSLDELDRLMAHFAEREARRQDIVPMTRIVPFAIFSTRRQEEITRIARADLDELHARTLIRDMKNPGEKIGNDVWCDLPPEAMRIIKAMSGAADRIFPYTTDAIGAAFTRAVALLGIDDLHFHDLRHDGVSRLCELGWSIPRVAAVSGHRNWQSLQRYTHLRQVGDKYAGWPWLDRICGS